MTSSAPQFFILEKCDQLHDGYRKVFSIGEHELLLLQHEGKVYLLENICPHAAYPLHEGLIIDAALRCPMHGYLFDLASGVCTYYTEGPCRGLHTYEVQYRNDEVGLVL